MKAKKSKRPRSTSSRPLARPKNSPSTTPVNSAALENIEQRPVKSTQPFWRRHVRRCLLIVGYILLVLTAAYLFYRRFPQNYQQPNFYAEDGFVFGANILHKGFLGSLLTTFNGYYIWGIYLVEKLGFMLNAVINGNQFTDLPRSLALASYGFLGFTATLPALLFRKYLRPQVIALICIISIFVPMLGYDYAVIGTIGNLKFAFAYIAFLLLIYRHMLPDDSRQFYAVDACLVICAYTDIVVYAMLPFALWRYLRRPKLALRKDFWQQLVRTRSFQSLAVAVILLLPQLYVIKTHGVPALKGYLDSPYQTKRTIELFVSRSYLYSVLFPFNKHLNDTWVVCTMIGFLLASWRVLRRWRAAFLFGIYTVLVATLLFVVKRTGVSALFYGYTSSGPDQFFYAQNWIFIFVVGLFTGELIALIKLRTVRLALWAVLLLGALFSYAPHSGSFGKNDFMANTVGTIYVDAKAACLQHPGAVTLSLPIYPATPLVFNDIPRGTLCTPQTLAYEPPVVSFGLQPFNNNYLQLAGNVNRFTQTFVAPRAGLDGVQVYFSTFGQKVRSPYTFTLFNANCQTPIRSVRLSTGQIADNDFYKITFSKLPSSAGKTYCFSVTSNVRASASPLAVQLSQPNTYTQGATTVNQRPLDTDVVFALYY